MYLVVQKHLELQGLLVILVVQILPVVLVVLVFLEHLGILGILVVQLHLVVPFDQHLQQDLGILVVLGNLVDLELPVVL
jgi:hypothetical protein